MDENLTTFVDHARSKGLDFAAIRQLLLAKGWKEKDIAAAFCARELDMPVPEPTGSSSARETFVYMLSFTALYTWVIALIVLVFTFINLALPDPAWNETYFDRTEFMHSAIRQSLAAIVVAFPLFLFLWRSLLCEIRARPEKSQSRVRLALTYLSLFVGAVTLISDVITLVYHLFEGELSTRFLLKVAALFVITGAILAYLVLTLRERPEEAP
jgi:hypothetical protein